MPVVARGANRRRQRLCQGGAGHSRSCDNVWSARKRFAPE